MNLLIRPRINNDYPELAELFSDCYPGRNFSAEELLNSEKQFPERLFRINLVAATSDRQAGAILLFYLAPLKAK